MQNVINICGLNGAGKSTLGRAIAEELGCRFLDIEDLYFSKDNSDYLYANPRSFEEVEDMLEKIISEDDTFVFAYVRGKFKEEILARFRCVIYLEVPKEVRLNRVYERSYGKFGERICEGGDLHEKEQGFFELVKSRDEKMVEDWLAMLSCPIIRVDGILPIEENVRLLAERIRKELQ